MRPPAPSAGLMPNRSHHEETSVRDELRHEVGPRNFDHWFHKNTTLAVSGEELTVGVASPFLLSWMQKKFRRPITSAAQRVLGPAASVRFEVDSRLTLASPQNAEDSPNADSAPASRPANPTGRPQKPPKPAGEKTARRRRFADLADFVEGEGNRLAVTAARQVAEAPGEKINPLFLYGGVGLGKTHLLEGIYRRLRRQYPALQVMYLTAEAFANYFTRALRDRTLPGFRHRFRNVDVLLVDDVDFLHSKRVIQEEFLHTVKQLEGHDRQIVLTADRHPRLLSKLSDELTTRCLAGLVCRVEPPDFEARRRIVGHKAARLEAEIAPQALDFVAHRFRNNVRELEGALNCLETHYSMNRQPVTLSAARRILADLERDCIRIVQMADVEQAVCGFFGLQPQELKSSRRHRSVSRPRMLAMFLARKHTQAAYSEIGAYFGGRNHSTVISAERKVEALLKDGTAIPVASRSWPLGEVLETLEHQLHAG